VAVTRITRSARSPGFARACPIISSALLSVLDCCLEVDGPQQQLQDRPWCQYRRWMPSFIDGFPVSSVDSQYRRWMQVGFVTALGECLEYANIW
jgi:hypothetical protein